MQRIARDLVEIKNQDCINLFAHYDEILSILRKYLPPSTSNLLARPILKNNNTTVEWYSDLEGQPRLLNSNDSDFNTAQSLFNQRLNAIKSLENDLVSGGKINSKQSKLLRLFIDGASHDTKQIYMVGNEPVLTGWGIGVVPPIITAPAPVSIFAKHRGCWWLLAALLLLLLGLLIWWFMFHPKHNIQPIENNPPPIVSPTPQPEPELAQPEPLPPVPEPEVEPEPEPEVAPVVPKKVCKTSYKKGETPQMVIVFDDSFSMNFSLLESQSDIEKFQERAYYNMVTKSEVDYMLREPTRLSTAKSASVDIINKIAKNVDIGLVALKTCPSSVSYGFYSPAKRKALRQKIKNMYPYEDNSGTPLYNGLEKAAAMVDGKKRDAFILILSDGYDNCNNSNICSLARNIAKRQPKLKVNVVDIGGIGAANCVARHTGGKVFTAKNKSQLVKMINQAVKPMTEIETCE